MDQDKAILILNLTSFPPLDVLEEIIEEEAFELRNYFLRNPVVAVLYRSRVRKLNQLEEIKAEFLRSNEPVQFPSSPQLSECQNFQELFSELEKAFTELRGEMSRGLEPKTIATLVEKMVEVQGDYEQQYVNLFQKTQAKEPELVQVKAADQISTGRALILMKSGDSEELTGMLEKEYNRIRGLIKRP